MAARCCVALFFKAAVSARTALRAKRVISVFRTVSRVGIFELCLSLRSMTGGRAGVGLAGAGRALSSLPDCAGFQQLRLHETRLRRGIEKMAATT